MVDYCKIGFKSGLEIHQQLDTGKLFCSCPGYLRSDEPHFSIKRKLHKVAGEMGEVDIAVKHESLLDREFEYQGYNDTTCLVEIDEEPPHLINESALDETIKVALLMNCEIYPISQVMRKTVIDGSNTSGFQRTVLIAHSGFIETSFGKVPIESIALEEDAARIISKDAKSAIYRLDRLGIPLVEIGTSPVMKNPEQIKEAALKIGEILRACKVKRGIGTIRQDINVSIKGHERVEIKGFQDPTMMVITSNKEIERQLEDIKNKKTESSVRNALQDGKTEFLRPLPGGARMYPETDLPLLRIGRERINKIKKNLPKLRHEIRDELKKKGLSDELINLILESNKVDEFEVLIRINKKDADLVAKMIVLWPREFATKTKKNYDDVREILSERALEKILKEFVAGKIKESDIKSIMSKIASGTNIESALKIESVDDNKLEEEIAKIVAEKPGLRAGGYMGLIIAKLGSNVDKRKAMEILRKLTE
ncbi:MAG: Glu-tRNA(Gln) amidotransferase subunit GatE [Nanoarchaeota archaeon]